MYNLWITEKSHNYKINAQIILLENDVVVVLSGGIEHIGAIGVAQPRQSIQNKDKIASTSSVYTFLGHKEDIIVKVKTSYELTTTGSDLLKKMKQNNFECQLLSD